MTGRALIRLLSIVVLLTALASLAAGCDGDPVVDESQPTPSGVNPDPAKGPGMYAVPPEPDLTTPESAVESYLDWIGLAYRLANSDVATHTFTPHEEVRVNSYVELNRQQNQAIEQTITVFRVREVSSQEPTATVSAYEEWRYRYFTLDTIAWVGEEIEAVFETTYTVVLQPDGRWLVDSVEAAQPSEVP